MKTNCKKNLEVLNFKEEAEVPELTLRIMSKLESPKNAVDQYTFLETIAEQTPVANSDKFEPKMMPDSDDAVTVVKEFPQSHTEPRANLCRSEINAPAEADVTATIASALPSNVKLNSSELDDAVSVDSHEHKSAFCAPSSDHCTGEWEMDDEDLTKVVLYPDHMVYLDSYFTDCMLTFTSSCIRMEGSTSNEDDKFFKFEWGIEELLHIKSRCYEPVEMAMVTIHVLTKDTIQAENAEYPTGTELKFTVIGNNWYERQEAITSLNVTYKALWSSMLESEDTVHGHSQVSFTKYFPNFDQPFEEVVYPKGDADAVSVNKRDIDLLLPDTFVNDTVIDFYIKYLKNKIKPEEKQRFHFFNSFFFRKLADPDKDQLDASQGRAAFQRVRKWTRKVNLFEKDYVFIPVNYNYHWSLIVMCHLGEVATCKDEDVNELIKVPCVLHMDSIRGSHTGLKGLMQSYLKEEWKGRQHEASEDISSRFDNLRFISLELPQQPNSFDCGLFLLHYVELFLEEAPVNFNPFKITKSVSFLNVDWFPPADASLKRVVIQRLVYDLLDHPSHEAPSMAANDEHHNSTSLITNIHEGTAVNFFPEMCNPSTACQNSQIDEGIEISLLPSLSIANGPCAADPCVALKPSFEPGSFLTMNFPSFNETTFDGYKNSLMPPSEEDVEGGGQFVYAPPTETGLQQVQGNGIAPEVSVNFETLPEALIPGCEDSLQVINGSNEIDVEFGLKETKEEPRSPLMEPIEMFEGNGNGCDNNLTLSCTQANGLATGSDESSELESDGQQHPTKKMRMTTEQPLEGGGSHYN